MLLLFTEQHCLVLEVTPGFCGCRLLKIPPTSTCRLQEKLGSLRQKDLANPLRFFDYSLNPIETRLFPIHGSLSSSVCHREEGVYGASRGVFLGPSNSIYDKTDAIALLIIHELSHKHLCHSNAASSLLVQIKTQFRSHPRLPIKSIAFIFHHDSLLR